MPQVFTHPCMGTEFRFHIYAESEQSATEAVQDAIRRIEKINKAASDYLPDSELSQINLTAANTPITLSPDLYSLVKQALHFSRLTQGAFDPTAFYSIQNWRRAKRQKKLPDPDSIQHAIALTGWQYITLDDARGTLTKTHAGVKLDLGAIGKGYAADEALKTLKKHGIKSALVAASGDLAIGAPPPEQDGWEIQVKTFTETAVTVLKLHDCGISTSGDLHQFIELEGKRWSHIINPKTGLGLTERIAASVIAPNCTTSDALSTSLCVMGPHKAANLLSQMDGKISWRIVKLAPDDSLEIHTHGTGFTNPDGN